MRFLLLSPGWGMAVWNLVATSLLIGLAALAAARMFRQADSLRYGILCVALLMMAMSPLPIAAMNYLGIGFIPVPRAPQDLANVGEVASQTLPITRSVPPQEVGFVEQVPPSTIVTSSTQARSVSPERDLESPGFESPGRSPEIEDASSMGGTGPGKPAISGGVSLTGASLFVVVWIVGAIVLIVRLVLSLLIVRRLRHSILASTNPRLNVAATRVRSEWRISALVVESNLAPTPLTMGFLRPVIVIPEGLVAQLDDEELDCVLSHEAAHVLRRDTTMALLQQLTTAAFWWNPMLRMINRRINNIRERICDAHVAHRRGDGLTMARTLVSVAEWSSNRWSKVPLVAPLLEQGGLEHRVLILTSKGPSATTSMNRWSQMLLACFAFALGGTSLVPLMRYEALASAPGAPTQEQPPQETGVAPANADGTAITNLRAEAKNADTPETEQKTFVWREGTTVSGRVVNHNDMAVEKAEVLLLGQERIIVDADQKTWFIADQSSVRPASSQTNANGEFTITRQHGEADRIAVIAEDPIFWAFSRDSLPQADNVELKLPAAGALAVHCDLPEKWSEISPMIELVSFDGKARCDDTLRFRWSDTSLISRGEKVFEQLPPGHYAVQLYAQSKIGKSSRQITDLDRQLVEVTAEKQSTVRFDRKVGHPLTGRVVGLENADLKLAVLTIRHTGPEEVMDKEGHRGRRAVAFDVISIDSGGQFTTDPIPPGSYHASLFAVLASTPDLSTQSGDFSGGTSFTVAEQGELPKVEVIAIASAPRDLSKATDLRIRAVDEEGNPIPKLQAMIHMATAGYGHWTDGRDGIVFLGGPSEYRAEVLDVFVRADGFASAFARFEGEKQRAQLSKGEATLTLHRGAPVQLQFDLPPDMTWPKGTLPETYFDNMQDRVRTMRQSVNRRSGSVPDFNFLNLRDIGDGRFEFRLAEETPLFHAAIHAPDFLQYFEAGSFTFADVKDHRIQIEVPEPATVEVAFKPGEHARADNNFKSASLTVMRQLQGDSYSIVATSEGGTLEPKLALTDLAPGNYMVDVRTEPKDESKPAPPSTINPGAYFDRKELALAAGQHERIDFRSVPYRPAAFRGSRTAILRIKTPDGKPAIDRNIQVSYFDGHYGSQIVFEGVVPASGEVVLAHITDKVPSNSRPIRTYSVTCEGNRLGSFGFTKQDGTEELEFFLVPGEGDLAPDVTLTNLATGQEIDLDSFRGKVVLLEFWATWCGPCQQPMEKLNAFAAERSADWKDRVVIVPVSIDGDRDRVAPHVQSHGWTSLNHFMTGTREQGDFDADAARQFVVSGVPEAILIGPDGRIRWRGHPLEQYSGKSLDSLISDALQ